MAGKRLSLHRFLSSLAPRSGPALSAVNSSLDGTTSAHLSRSKSTVAIISYQNEALYLGWTRIAGHHQ